MGAPSIEARLRSRLLAVIAPALVGVGAASVVVTAKVLDAADRRSAKERAESAVHALATERTEGDPFDQAAGEVLTGAAADGVRMAVRDSSAAPWRHGPGDLGRVALALPAGECTTVQEDGEAWCACADHADGFEVVAAIPVGAHRALLWTLAQSMLAVVAIALLAVLWAARRAVRGSVESLAKLVRWTEQVGEEAPAGPPAADSAEVERLVASFGKLVERLFEALSRERANSAHIAHELRTPLTVIRAELEGLPLSPRVERVRSDVAGLERVVEAILVLSAPRERAPHAAVVNVADLVREAVTADTVIDAPEEALVDGDARLITLALQNLLENAQKYSGHAARTVRVSRERGQARLAVIDDGPGADAETMGKMFDRYWRAAGDGEGSGLGLALVRAVAERHGGKAEALASASGKGLEVAMTLGRLVEWHDPR